MDTTLDMSPMTALAILQILWINLLLSGDNAVVIALACRALPPRQKAWGLILGSSAAVLLRIIFSGMAAELMALPYIKVLGAAALLVIAVRLVAGEEEHETGRSAQDTLWSAVRTIVIADVAMSLDNVLAVAAAAKGNIWLIGFGLLLSIPLVVGGSTLLSRLLERLPILVWGGGALLGWVAGELLVEDPLIEHLDYRWDDIAAPVIGAAGVVVGGLLMRRWRRQHALTATPGV